MGETHVQVPGPIALLQAKLAHVADVGQAGRQDVRHVLILARLMPAYLSDLQESVTDGRMEERTFLEFLERLLAMVTAGKPKKILDELQIDPRLLFTGLGDERMPKLKSFLEKRLPRKMRSAVK